MEAMSASKDMKIL